MQQPDYELPPAEEVSPAFSSNGPVPQGGDLRLLPYRDIFDNDSCPRTVLLKLHSKCPGAYRPPELYAALLYASGSHIAPPFTP